MSEDDIDDAVLPANDRVGARRYECYPGAAHFVTDFDAGAYGRRLQDRAIGDQALGIGLYVRGLPRDESGRRSTEDRESAQAAYMAYLRREFECVAAQLSSGRVVTQLFCRANCPDAGKLLALVRRMFDLRAGGDYVMHVDLCDLSPDRVAHLSERGFTRLRIDIRDSASVGKLDELSQTVLQARTSGFGTVEIVCDVLDNDMLHFQDAVACLIAAAPDSVILHQYSNPRFPARVRFDALSVAVELFEAAGYVYLGMDHFVREHDELALARRRGRLNYDVRGYFTGASVDSLGFGLGAISRVADIYAQNETELTRYGAALDGGRLPIRRGRLLSQDDLLRRGVIHALICHLEVSFEAISVAYLIDFKRYFARELKRLEKLAGTGAVELTGEWITVTPTGRLQLPAICEVFDIYRPQPRPV